MNIGKAISSIQNLSLLIVLVFLTSNCSDKTKIIGQIREPFDSTKFVTPEGIANEPDSDMFTKVFVSAFVGHTNFDHKNHAWIKFWISKHAYVIAKPLDDNSFFPPDLNGMVIFQGKLRNYAEFKNNIHQKNLHRLLGKYWYINDYELLKPGEHECKYVLLVDHLNY